MADYDWFTPTEKELEREARFSEHHRSMVAAWAANGYEAVYDETKHGGRWNDPTDPQNWKLISLCCNRCGCYVNPKKVILHDSRCNR